MSVKRYQPVAQCVEPSYQAQMIVPKVMEFSEGEYVLHSDYARLKAEVERLRKAGDAMADAIYESDPEKLEAHKKFKLTDEEYNAVQLWNAAKEGKSSV